MQRISIYGPFTHTHTAHEAGPSRLEVSLGGQVVSQAVTFEYKATQQQLERMAAEIMLDQPLADCQLNSDGEDEAPTQQQSQQQKHQEGEEQLELTLLKRMCLLGEAPDTSAGSEPRAIEEALVNLAESVKRSQRRPQGRLPAGLRHGSRELEGGGGGGTTLLHLAASLGYAKSVKTQLL